MDKPSFKLVGAPCGQHGQYTFYKALRITGEKERIIAIGDFFFVRIWQDSELVSIGELQLLWTDRVSDQTLVSLRLYFLPENTPDGRNQHGQDEVLAINDKVVLKAEDLLSWACCGAEWRWGLRAVWRGACAPPANPRRTQPLHHTRMDFSDVDREKSAITEDADSPGVVVFSYPRYCRYRALLARLEGIQGDWLRDSLVCALGGYAAPTRNTRILYCKDTFEYPELEGHEFVCNQLAPKLKGRPRGRRRRRAERADRADRAERAERAERHDPSPSDRSSDSDSQRRLQRPLETPRRLSLRNGAPRYSDDEDKEQCGEDRAFIQHLKQFFRERKETFKPAHSLKDLSLRTLYQSVTNHGGYEAACRHKLWRQIHAPQPNTARRHYERFLLALEKHEVSNGIRTLPKLNGTVEQPTVTIELPDSREPSPAPKDPDVKDFSVTSKPAEELNREFLDSLPPKEENKLKITVKPVEKLLEEPKKEKEEPREGFYSELKTKLNLVAGNADSKFLSDIATAQQELVSGGALGSLSSLVNGHAPPRDQSRPPTRSSLRHVRVKPARAHHSHHHHHHQPHHHQPHHQPHQPHAPATNTPTPLRPDSASSSPPAAPATPAAPAAPAAPTTPAVTNFGIHHPPPPPTHSDDEIVEVPYKPKTPEIIDLDEYPESPQSVKKKKLDILKERGLEVTAIPTTTAAWPPTPTPLVPGASLAPLAPLVLSPAVQHQIMTQAQIFQMYNIIPPNYPNGTPPKVIQATSAFGSSGPEKTVYGNPKDPFMPPPHVLLGTPMKPLRNSTVQVPSTPPQDILDLTCKNLTPGQKPAVEIVRIPSVPSPSKTPSPAQNLTKNYTLADGKAIVGSNLEITLVNPKSQTPTKSRQQKRSSNGKFVAKTPTPPKDYPKTYTSPSQSGAKKPPIVVPNYQINQRDDVSPTSSTGSGNSQTNLLQNNLLQNVFKGQNSLQQMMDMQKNVPTMPYVDPYMSALYSSLAGGMDQRQLAMYRDFMANQFRGYSGLLGVTPTTKN